jgi:hypothetical protein
MNAKRIAAFAVALTMMGSVLAFTPPASAYVRAGVRVYAPLPPLRHEVVVVRPGPRHVWVPGYWSWENRSYAWVPGTWILPPYPRAVWVGPRVIYRHRHPFYYGGYWRR